MLKSVIYHGNSPLGEVDIYHQNPNMTSAWTREIRISHFSPPSERCPPLAVLYTIASAGPCVRIESRCLQPDASPLFLLHATCVREKKTAIVLLGDEELHLVAMPYRRNFEKCSCFWGFNTVQGLYNSCLVMLNLRCLGIVFDLDETLIVANTMRSFEDRIDSLQRKINTETDPQRVSAILAEVKRYQDDQCILKQYAENDQVVDNGKVFKVQSEIVPPLSDGHQPISRPIIRLQEKNIILTRVNPAIRDTSVLVRLRPAWDDLRSYLTARGRKRFEVYVCTMAERDYALEMWRLLDPESNLINSKQLLDRIVCVKSGSRKSLFNVFQDGICHPKMALVIDDRLKVWDDKDQPRVHVVPAFAPYYAPQAEANGAIPVLCVARNVACNVRGGFFKEFDEGLLSRISDVFYEDELVDFPSAPDVGNYLISEDDTSASNGNKDPVSFEGMADAEVERRLKEANFNVQANPSILSNLDPRALSSLQHVLASSGIMVTQGATQVIAPLRNNQYTQTASVKPVSQPGLPETSLQGSPAREEGEVPESELDPNTRRRLLILQHGQDTREHIPSDSALPAIVPMQVSVTPPVQPHGNWYPLEEEMSPRKMNRSPKEFPFEPDAVRFDKSRSHHSFFHRMENSIRPERTIHESQRLSKEVYIGDGKLRLDHAVSNYHSVPGEDVPVGRMSSNNRDAHFESGRVTSQYSDTPAGVLLDIATKCGNKVEFRTALADTTELQFSIEVWFVGEKIGEGIGRTRKDAQHQAAESSLRYLANKYLSTISLDPGSIHGEVSLFKENGSVSNKSSFWYPASQGDDHLTSTSEPVQFQELRVDRSKASTAAIATLKELCILEGFNMTFQKQPAVSSDLVPKGEVIAQVEIAGQLLGKGSGMTWEEAKLQAALEAIGNLQSMRGQFTQKRSASPRQAHTISSKRLKQDLSRTLQRVPSARYFKDDAPVL
uniref:protein-serine/threonine phosphatase n=1 Tax=Anthurium amnicola TaxID=1678845 RepID=A0A1D1Y7J3_9ARAE